MTEQHEDATTDLAYDLAHEVTGGGGNVGSSPDEHAMPNMPADDGGDYSYDLAHDVPGR